MNLLDNIGMSELLIILLLVLLVVGPERLPEMGRKLAKFLRDVRKMYENATRDLDPEIGAIQQTVKEVMDSTREIASIPRDAVRALTQTVTPEAPETKVTATGQRPPSNMPGAPGRASKDDRSAAASANQPVASQESGSDADTDVPGADLTSASCAAGEEAKVDG